MRDIGFAYLITVSSDNSGETEETFCVLLETFHMSEVGQYAEDFCKENYRDGSVNCIKYLGPALISEKLIAEYWSENAPAHRP